jgi:hypothetical protein
MTKTSGRRASKRAVCDQAGAGVAGGRAATGIDVVRRLHAMRAATNSWLSFFYIEEQRRQCD